MIGLGLSVVQLAVRQLLGFDPKSLFAAGEQGVWYDPNDMSTMFQDAAGTTPVTAVEQPVGRILDKSGRGNHATQTTATSRPVLSARVNLLTGTETLATQTVTTRATTQTLRFEGAGTVTLSGTATGTYSAGSHSITTTAGNLTLTVSGTVTKADLRAANMGIGLPAYQRVNTATDYDTAGFPHYLRFDGVDDFLATPSIDFTAINNISVFAGVRKLSDAARGIIVEQLTFGTAGVTSFGLSGPQSNGAPNYAAFISAVSLATVAAPSTNVLTGLYAPKEIVAQTALKVNGGVGIAADGLVTSSVVNQPIFIGRRGNATLPFNGNLYSLIVRGAQSTAQQIASAEAWVNGKTGAY